MSSGDDAAAVRRVLDGEVDAFAELVARHGRRVYQLARRFEDDSHAAEDLAQEVLVKAFRSLRQWRGDSAFSTWLHALAANHLRSHARRVRPRSEPLEELPAEAPEPAEADEELRDAVRRAVRVLPARYREALELYYFHRMDVAAAAASLGVATGTLKARLSRGRKLVERALASRAAATSIQWKAEGRVR